MAADYKLTSSSDVIRTADGAIIPDDAGNADRRSYAKWLAAGNVPDPADVAAAQPIMVKNLYIRRELLARGLFDAIDGLVHAAAAGGNKEPLQYWDYATEFQHDHPLTLQFCAAASIDDETRLDIFTVAKAKELAGDA